MTTFFTSAPHPMDSRCKAGGGSGLETSSQASEREAQSQVKCQCEISGTTFSNGEKLKPHSLSHPEQRPYSCPQLHCGKTFVSRYKLYKHMATHSAEKPHQCMYCDKMFHHKDHLRNHLQTHDPKKEALHCSECSKNYNTKLSYQRHLASKVCLQTSESTQALQEHLKAHSHQVAGNAIEKKHSCDHCHQFYTPKDVQRHLVVHTGWKDFLCQYCAQRFGHKDHLTQHVKKNHSQELFMIKTEPVGMLGLLSCSSTVNVKERLSPMVCMASRDVTGTKALPGTWSMGMFGAHIPTMPSTGVPHSLVHNTLLTSMSYPLESSPISSPAQLPPKYQLGSTSYLQDKLPKEEVDSFLVELPASLSLSSAKPQPTSPQPASSAALLDEALLTNSSTNLSEALCAANVDFSHLQGFLPAWGYRRPGLVLLPSGGTAPAHHFASSASRFHRGWGVH